MQHIAEWNKKGSLDETIAILTELALSHAAEGGDQGKYIANCIISGNFRGLCDYSPSYVNGSAWQLKHVRQAQAFFGKLEPLDIGHDKRNNAVEKFLEAEEACLQTNELFEKYDKGEFYFLPWVEDALKHARSKISYVLGEAPRLVDVPLRFGPGATTLTKKRSASVTRKLSDGASVSESLLPFVREVLEEMPHFVELHAKRKYFIPRSQRKLIFGWNDRECEQFDGWASTISVLVEPGVVEFVPKNAKTYRAIIKQPVLDGMVQNGIGDIMAKKLLRVGLDISDQSINQKLAFQGSLSGDLATLDLSSASDTIATELVRYLLPPDWAYLLDCARTVEVILDGEVISQHKFSSMGNGFTFPLETLIFWALSSSVSTGNFASVYGDDIIVPTDSALRVMRLLETCGFTINKEKSFWTGPFRESCGADYVSGIDIRPCYVKDVLSPADLFRVHNFYVRDGDEERANLVKRHIHPSLRLYGPDGYGDGHLLGDWKPRPKKTHKLLGYGGGIFETFRDCGKRDFSMRSGDRVLPVYSIYRREAGEEALPEFDSKSNYLGRLRFQSRILADIIPERTSPVTGEVYKTPSIPGVKGYKKISIYTFDRGS